GQAHEVRRGGAGHVLEQGKRRPCRLLIGFELIECVHAVNSIAWVCRILRSMFAIKAEVRNPSATTLTFSAQKTMYGGKRIVKGDSVFIFASENEGGSGLIARGVVTSAKPVAKRLGI